MSCLLLRFGCAFEHRQTSVAGNRQKGSMEIWQIYRVILTHITWPVLYQYYTIKTLWGNYILPVHCGLHTRMGQVTGQSLDAGFILACSHRSAFKFPNACRISNLVKLHITCTSGRVNAKFTQTALFSHIWDAKLRTCCMPEWPKWLAKAQSLGSFWHATHDTCIWEPIIRENLKKKGKSGDSLLCEGGLTFSRLKIYSATTVCSSTGF
jgi:hypothetical protein